MGKGSGTGEVNREKSLSEKQGSSQRKGNDEETEIDR